MLVLQTKSWQRTRLCLVAVALALIGWASASQAADSETQWTLKSMEARKTEQIKLAKQAKAFYGFQFSNAIDQSGITFENQIVEDCGRLVRPIIYDHGTGVAAADVDGDGKTDIFFVNQIGGCELWRNLGNGKFENITELAGVGLKDKICVAASFADIDNDGDPDLFVTTVRMGNVLFENLGGGKFRNVTESSGLGYVGHSSGAVFFDFDKDGLLDLFLANVGNYTTDQKGRGGYYMGITNMAMGFSAPERNEPSILYKNLGGLKFKNVSKEMHLEHVAWSGDASFGDVNGDGYPDLYVLNMSGPNSYYENQGGKGFQNKTQAYFPKTPPGAMGIKFFDFDQDGNIDLFLTDMHSDMSAPQIKVSNRNFRLDFEKSKSESWCGEALTPQERAATANVVIFGNAFYRNTGGGRFNEISDKINAETFWPWGMSIGDLNADGYEDAFVTSGMGYPFRYGINSVLLNDGGQRFFDAEFLINVEPRAGNRIFKENYFTLDCSGEDKNHPLCYHKSGLVKARGPVSSRSSLMADLDGDGDLDIVVEEFNDRPQILINNLTDKKAIHFLKIKLVGTVSNRDGLGAVVRVKAGGKTYTQPYDGKSGYLSQSSLPLYFGLGTAERVDSVEVTWPSGTKQTLASNLPINQQIEIKEPRP